MTAAIIGIGLLTVGGSLSLLTFAHDIRRALLARAVPQGAPRRILPEIHLLAALLAGVGAGLHWGWLSGGLCLGLYLVVYLVIRPLLERL